MYDKIFHMGFSYYSKRGCCSPCNDDFFFVSADSDIGDSEIIHDTLICGTCQKTFALADIITFIHHKVLHLNKENYEQCFQQGKNMCVCLYIEHAFYRCVL